MANSLEYSNTLKDNKDECESIEYTIIELNEDMQDMIIVVEDNDDTPNEMKIWELQIIVISQLNLVPIKYQLRIKDII